MVLGSSRKAEATSFEGENTQQYSGTSTGEVVSLSVFLTENHGMASSFLFQVCSQSVHKPLGAGFAVNAISRRLNAILPSAPSNFCFFRDLSGAGNEKMNE